MPARWLAYLARPSPSAQPKIRWRSAGTGLDGREDARVEPLVEARHGHHHGRAAPRPCWPPGARWPARRRRSCSPGPAGRSGRPRARSCARAAGSERKRSFSLKSTACTPPSKLCRMLPWVSTTPFGLAVVPEVWTMVATLSRPIRGPALGPLADLARIGGGKVEDVVEADRAIGELAAVVDHDHVLQRRALGPHLVDLGRLLQVLDEDQPRLDVVDHEGGLVRLDRWVDRAGHGAEREGAEVGRQPGGAGAAHDADRGRRRGCRGASGPSPPG